MILTLFIIAVILLGSAAAAMLLRNLVHSALLLTLTWLGTAAFYLWAGAEFAAFAQVIVYVGAVSMVVLFAVLLTRQSPVTDVAVEPATLARAVGAFSVAACVAAVLSAAVLASDFRPPAERVPNAGVQRLGIELMNRHGAALLILGVLLTVALIGAVVLAAGEPNGRARPPSVAKAMEDRPGGPLASEDPS